MISCQRLAGPEGAAKLSASLLTSAAALHTTLLAICQSRIAGGENRRLPTSIRYGIRL